MKHRFLTEDKFLIECGVDLIEDSYRSLLDLCQCQFKQQAEQIVRLANIDMIKEVITERIDEETDVKDPNIVEMGGRLIHLFEDTTVFDSYIYTLLKGIKLTVASLNKSCAAIVY